MNNNWQLWKCIPSIDLMTLALYQWKNYGAKLDVITGAQRPSDQASIESVDEIGRLMREKRPAPKGRA